MMASACVNNAAMPTETFLDCPLAYPSKGWRSPSPSPSPRISFSRDFVDDGPKVAKPEPAPNPAGSFAFPDTPDQETTGKDLVDFEFRLDDPVAMLPADELFYDGKLVPLQLAATRPAAELAAGIRSPEAVTARRSAEVSRSDPYFFSPRAPRCSSSWRELLGLTKQQTSTSDPQKGSSAPSKSPNLRSLKHFLHRNPKRHLTDSSLSLPLLRDSDSESVSISSSRLSLSSSSSSSGPEHEDLPRLPLDSDSPSPSPSLNSLGRNLPRFPVPRPRFSAAAPESQAAAAAVGRSLARRAAEATPLPRVASVESPRMNASGKIVFQGLERSSSSPGSFSGGGPRPGPRGMERSYSANVHVTPVLNVPVCSLRGSAKSVSVFGLGHLFSPLKERDGSSGPRTSATGGKVRIERA